MRIFSDESMPPIYDDYMDESGFGRVSTLGSSDPTIFDDVESYCDENESGFGEVIVSVKTGGSRVGGPDLCVKADGNKK